MADVSVCARPEDGSRAHNKAQKRPLSIIREFDQDDNGELSFIAFCEKASEINAENTFLCNDSQKSCLDNNHTLDGHNDPEHSKIQDDEGNDQLRESSQQPTSKQSSECKSVSEILHRNSASELSPQDHEICQNNTSHNHLNVQNQLAENASLKHITISEIRDPKFHSNSESDSHSTTNIINEETVSSHRSLKRNLITSRSNRVNVTKSPDNDLQKLSSLPTLSPKLDHRLLLETSMIRTFQDVQNVPHVSVTSNDSGSRLVSPATDPEDFMRNNKCKIIIDFCNNNTNSFGYTNRSCHCPNCRRLRLSPRLARRRSTESTGSTSESEVKDGSYLLASPDHLRPPFLSDLRKLKETAERLHLSTRRPSTLLWKQKYIENNDLPTSKSAHSGDNGDELSTSDRMQKIDEILEWLRNELQEMRNQDQNLARQLLSIRHDIHQLKLQRCTEEHQELIEDFQSELDDLQEFSDLLDFPRPGPEFGVNPLKQIGVTRLNISARRFSAC